MTLKYALDMGEANKKIGIEYDGPNHYLIGY